MARREVPVMQRRPSRAFLAGAAFSLLVIVAVWAIWVWLGSPPLSAVSWGHLPAFPQLPGLPSDLWAPVRDLREAVRANAVLLSIVLVSSSVLGAACWVWRRGRAGVLPGLALVSVALALAGELLVLASQFAVGAALYVAAGVVLCAALIVSRDQPTDALEPVAWSRRREGLALTLIMLVVMVSRLYQIGAIPYGWEGDEVNWVAHVVETSARTGVERVYPLNHMPTSYWMQAPAHQLLGTSTTSARVGIALFSILATALFYFAVRAMVNIPVALLSTYLMAVSIVDIAASRVAHVEAHVKIWGILAALCLLVGYRRGSAALFLCAGIALALGLMVYDSFIFVPVPFVLYMLYRLVRDRAAWRRQLAYIGLLALPIVLAAPSAWAYLGGRHDNQLSVLTGSTGVFVDSPGKVPQLLPVLPAYVVKQAGITLYRLTFQALNDVLLGRPGPLESALFIPFLFLGLILAIRYWRRGQILFALLWLLVPALPTSLLIGQTVPRTFYPYWGAFQVMAAIAIWVLYRTFTEGLPGRARWLPAAALGLGLAFLGLSNLYVYFNEVSDPPERQLRRELGDVVAANIAPGELVFLPYLPLWNDIMGFERNAPWIETRDRIPLDQQDKFYRFVPYPDLLAQISAAKPSLSGLKLVYDKTLDPPGPRKDILDAFQRCFPGAQVRPGKAFDVYSVTAQGLAKSTCYSDVDIQPLRPGANDVLTGNPPTQFTWHATRGAQTEYQLQLDRQHDGVTWLEAETFALGHGWAPAATLAPGFTGDAYMADVEVSDTISTSQKVQLAEAGTYDIWARTYRRRDDHSPAYLSVDDHKSEIANPATSALNQWQWEHVGRQTLTAGSHLVRLGRTFDRASDPWPIFVDAVVLSADPAFDPNGQTEWTSVVDTGPTASAQYGATVALPLPPGHYRWRVKVTDGERLVAPDGSIGLFSPYGTFRVSR
jgi:hypothetical protein